MTKEVKSGNLDIKFGFLISILALALDQGSKFLAISYFEALKEGISVFPGLNLTIVRNTGISFGLLSFASPSILVAVSFVICAWILLLMRSDRDIFPAIGCGMIIGGAIGNSIDRIRLGGVTDFIDIYVGEMHWPSFNMADVAIVSGATIVTLRSFAKSHKVQSS